MSIKIMISKKERKQMAVAEAIILISLLFYFLIKLEPRYLQNGIIIVLMISIIGLFYNKWIKRGF